MTDDTKDSCFEPARLSDLVIEIDLAHPPDRVWAGLTTEIGSWWPGAFYGGGTDGERRFLLETFPGGRMVELWDGGGGLLWGTVLTVDPGRKLEVTGHASPAWGGPGVWIGEWTLEEAGSGTRLRFRESAIGRVDPKNVAGKDRGWTYLWDGALRAWLDGEECPPWSD